MKLYIPSEEIENIRSSVRYSHSLGEEITFKNNKIHALLTPYGTIIKATDPLGNKVLMEIWAVNRFDNKEKFALYTGLTTKEEPSRHKVNKGTYNKAGAFRLGFFLV